MTTGQSLEQSNVYRRCFYQEAIKLATEVSHRCSPQLFSENNNYPSTRPRIVVKWLSGRDGLTKTRGNTGGYTMQEGNFVNL